MNNYPRTTPDGSLLADVVIVRQALSDLCDKASAHAISSDVSLMAGINTAYEDGLAALRRINEELAMWKRVASLAASDARELRGRPITDAEAWEIP